MQTITIKIKDKENSDFLVELLSKFNFVYEINNTKNIYSNSTSDDIVFPSAVAPKIEDFAGVWSKSPKTLDQIRELGWLRI